MDDSATENDRRGMWSMIKEAYEGLVMTVIRPLRARYHVDDLGPKQALIVDTLTERVDLQLKNPAGYVLECSWWKPRPKDKNIKIIPCIVVLHGNSSCRLGALEIVGHAIPAGFSVFALDFSGSGLSDGKYVSLGYHEKTDIATVVEYLRKSNDTSGIILWGRSMGAVASCLYAENDPNIQALVLDSPFASLPQLATELVLDGKLGVPKVAVSLVMRLIRRDVKKRAKFDIFKLKPVSKINKCTIPAFFIVGAQDELVGPHHVLELHKLHNGPKQLFKFPGGHNCPRPALCYYSALQFVRVMIGLMPIGDSPPTSPSQMSPSKLYRSKEEAMEKAPSFKSFKNPLESGMTIDEVHRMSIKELKGCITRAGWSDVTCIEKKELIDLVLKLYARYVLTRSFSGEEDDTYEKESTLPPRSPTKAYVSQTTSADFCSNHDLDVSHSPRARRHSADSYDPTQSGADSTNTKAFFPPKKKKSFTSVIPDSELSRAFSEDCEVDTTFSRTQSETSDELEHISCVSNE